jgi:hypothetical protein
VPLRTIASSHVPGRPATCSVSPWDRGSRQTASSRRSLHGRVRCRVTRRAQSASSGPHQRPRSRRRPKHLPDPRGADRFASRMMSRPPRCPWRHDVRCRASPTPGSTESALPGRSVDLTGRGPSPLPRGCAAAARGGKAAPDQSRRARSRCPPRVRAPPTPELSRKGAGGEPAPGLEPGTARLQDRCHPPHLAPTSDYGYAAVPSGCLKPHGLTPFRVTNDVTPDRTAQGQH